MKILTFNLLTVLQIFLPSCFTVNLVYHSNTVYMEMLIFSETKSVHLFFSLLTFKSQYTPEM